MRKVVVFFLLFALLLSGCSDLGSTLEQAFGELPPTQSTDSPTRPIAESAPAEETLPPISETQPPVPTETAPPEAVVQKTYKETIVSLNALLLGMQHNSYFNQRGSVSQWSDEAICDAIHSKLMWYDYNPANAKFLESLNLDPQYGNGGDWDTSYDLAAIDALTRSCFGREYPRNSNTDYHYISGDRFCIMMAAGESESMSVQSFTKQGNILTAIGTAVHHNSIGTSFDGYFTAQFAENPDSLYGYTLISYDDIPGNQSFSSLTAEASSILKEPSFTHYASNALDGSLSTAWVEGVNGVGEGEWIQLSTTDGSSLHVAAIGFFPGYHKSQSHLENNGWPSKILIEAENGFSQTAEFYWNDEDVILLDRPISTHWIKITILEAAAGAKFTDTCISEISLYGLVP